MKYFAKWLPVPGPVKTGDNFIYQGALYSCKKVDEDGWVLHNNGLNPTLDQAEPGECDIVMLHLCCYEVPSIGAKLTCLVGNYLGAELVVTDTWLSAMGTWHWVRCADSVFKGQALRVPDQAVKVLGLISPGAIWVNAEDEFEAEQIETTATGKIVYWNGAFMSHYAWSKDDMFKYIRIKCPSCGTFH